MIPDDRQTSRRGLGTSRWRVGGWGAIEAFDCIWPAPGSADTESGVLMGSRGGEAEGHAGKYRLESCALIKDRGVFYVQASQDLGVHPDCSFATGRRCLRTIPARLLRPGVMKPE